jgi:hypothetical protein
MLFGVGYNRLQQGSALRINEIDEMKMKEYSLLWPILENECLKSNWLEKPTQNCLLRRDPWPPTVMGSVLKKLKNFLAWMPTKKCSALEKMSKCLFWGSFCPVAPVFLLPMILLGP